MAAGPEEAEPRAVCVFSEGVDVATVNEVSGAAGFGSMPSSCSVPHVQLRSVTIWTQFGEAWAICACSHGGRSKCAHRVTFPA